MTDTGNEALRAQFEKWYAKNCLDSVARGEDGKYLNLDAQFAWNVWQAAYAAGAASARAKENEACAELVENYFVKNHSIDSTMCGWIAKTIRAREQRSEAKLPQRSRK